MRRVVALAAVAALAAVIGVAHPARPLSRAPATTREHPAIPQAEAAAPLALPADLDRLLHELRHGTTLERARAARAMRRLGGAAAPLVADLVGFLRDEEGSWDRVRDEIEDVLVAIGEEAVPGAMELIGQANRAGRTSGIEVLARIRGEAAVAPLAGLLRDPAVGKHAADRLARLGEPGRAALLAAVADGSVPLKTIGDAVADAGKPLALPLGALLSSTEPETRERAARMLKKLGKNARPAADAILHALADPSFGDRLTVVEILEFLDEIPPSMAIVLADLARSHASTEAAAHVRRVRTSQGLTSKFLAARSRELAPLRALADLGPAMRDALPALLEIMDGGDPDATAAAFRAYWRIGGDVDVALDRLIATLAPFPDGGYHPAIPVLGEMGGEAARAIPALLHEMASPRLQRAHGAASALAAMGGPALRAVREWLPTAEPALSSTVMMTFGESLRDELIARFGEEATGFFEFVEAPEEFFPAAVAGVEGDPLIELRRQLRDGEGMDLTFAALGMMGEWAAPAVPDLVALLGDDDLRDHAASTLGAIGRAANGAVPALEALVEDSSAAVEALWRITGDTRYRDLRFAPSEIQAGDDWALSRLIGGLSARHSAGWRRECAEALGRLGPSGRPAAADLARLAADEAEDEHVRDAAREALARIG